MKMVISDPKSGKAYQVEKDIPTAVGMKLGDSLDGSLVGLTGYTVEITGGSDNEGFPMRRDLPGPTRRRILLKGGIGYRPKDDGVKRRKSVRGRVISEDIVQLNMKITKHGDQKIEKLLGLEQEEAPAESAEAKTEEKTE